MEYNLLKTIEPSLQRIFTPTSSFSPLLTAFPAQDFINPGKLIYTYFNINLSKNLGVNFLNSFLSLASPF